MYWCNPICHCEEQVEPGKGATKQSRCQTKDIYPTVIIIALLFTLLLPSCKPDIKETGATLSYFDLKGYIKNNAAQLNRLKRPVFKTMVHNGSTESKKVNIEDWERELGLFSGSDINKPAWKDSYQVLNMANIIFYKAKYPELETREITINKDGNKVKKILIINHTKNLLYETKEKLTYVPDSMYHIEKTQQVRLLGTNRYDIKGVIN